MLRCAVLCCAVLVVRVFLAALCCVGQAAACLQALSSQARVRAALPPSLCCVPARCP
jgi:hypothetical protein